MILTNPPVISIKQMDFSYPDNIKPVLNKFSVNFPRRMITAILGTNGSGKSTLLHLILGDLKPNQGKVEFNLIKDNHPNITQVKGRVAFVPQNEYLAFDYSVLEYVLFGRTPFINLFSSPVVKDIDFAKKTIDELHLSMLMNKKITHLSGGELQKVRIARALAQEPEILLLDEPTTFLDLFSKNSILEILKKLVKTGVSIIFATHDPNEAIAIGDFFLLMQKNLKIISGDRQTALTAKNLSKIYSMNLKIVEVEGKQLII